MEHSTLCGSRKFPLKEPFVELAKGSLNTFLNAMTWPDKTMYPVASRNSTDFHNLMDVYLDAVFYPDCLQYVQMLFIRLQARMIKISLTWCMFIWMLYFIPISIRSQRS